MEGWKGQMGRELANAVSAQEEKSFLELLCEADPSIQAWEDFRAYRPEFVTPFPTQRAPPTEMVLPGKSTENELGVARSNLKFCEERVDASGVGKFKMKRKRASKKCQQCKLLTGCNCKETKPQKDVSWVYVNMKKDKLEGRLAELHDLVTVLHTKKKKLNIASVFQEAEKSIVSLLDELKVLTSFYLQHSVTSRHVGGEESGLRSRGLCLVPTSAVAHSFLVHKRWTEQ